MEGYQDVFWLGDQILWENLLRHYVLLLISNVTLAHMSGNTYSGPPPVRPTMTEDDLPTDAFRRAYRSACDKFLEETTIAALPEQLGRLSTPLRIAGLRVLLAFVHHNALAAISRTLADAGMLPPGFPLMSPREVDLSYLFLATERLPQHFDVVSAVGDAFRDMETLRVLAGPSGGKPSPEQRRRSFLLLSFPDHYATAIVDALVHPPWHVACFSESCTNASMWSTYADGHAGAALMFRIEHGANGAPSIPLEGVVAVASSQDDPQPRYQRGRVSGRLHRVEYEAAAPELDFFKFLGRLPRPKLTSSWYSNRLGQRSPLLERIFGNEAAWRRDLWNTFERMTTTKLPDWKHEQEYRIVMDDLLALREVDRKVTYEHAQLAGIVFGLKTRQADRLEIMRRAASARAASSSPALSFFQIGYAPSTRQLIRL